MDSCNHRNYRHLTYSCIVINFFMYVFLYSIYFLLLSWNILVQHMNSKFEMNYEFKKIRIQSNPICILPHQLCPQSLYYLSSF